MGDTATAVIAGCSTLGGIGLMIKYLLLRIEKKQDISKCDTVVKGLETELSHGSKQFEQIANDTAAFRSELVEQGKTLVRIETLIEKANGNN